MKIKTIEDARAIAREHAAVSGLNEASAEACAETWFDAGKDYDASGPTDLCRYLDQRLASQQ